MTAALVGAYRKSCPEKDCRLDQESHEECAAAQIADHACNGRLTHQHWPPKSKGGTDIAAILCWGIHDACDNGVSVFLKGKKRRIKNWVGELFAGGGNLYSDGSLPKVYIIADRDTNLILLEKTIQYRAGK